MLVRAAVWKQSFILLVTCFGEKPGHTQINIISKPDRSAVRPDQLCAERY